MAHSGLMWLVYAGLVVVAVWLACCDIGQLCRYRDGARRGQLFAEVILAW